MKMKMMKKENEAQKKKSKEKRRGKRKGPPKQILRTGVRELECSVLEQVVFLAGRRGHHDVGCPAAAAAPPTCVPEER